MQLFFVINDFSNISNSLKLFPDIILFIVEVPEIIFFVQVELK